MTTRELWEAKNETGDGDIARLTVNEKTGGFGLLVTDKGVPKVIVLSRDQVSKLVRDVGAYLVRVAVEENVEFEIQPRGTVREDYEKSEKDALWERGE